MAVKSYILIDTEVGAVEDVLAALRAMEGVRAADGVTGHIDIVAVAEVAELAQIGPIITSKIHAIPGVINTTTYLAVL